MKLVAENPSEDLILDALIKQIQENGYPYVYGETYKSSYAKEMLSSGLFVEHSLDTYDIASWSPQQRLWFFQVAETYGKLPECKKVAKEFIELMGVYDEIFREERKAFNVAVEDYSLYLTLEKNINLLHVNSYGKLQAFLEKSVNKGPNNAVKTVSTYYDKELASHVIELNSIKIPVWYENKRLNSQAVIYAWSDSDFHHSYEFFKYELLHQKEGPDETKSTVRTSSKEERKKKEPALVR